VRLIPALAIVGVAVRRGLWPRATWY